MVRRVLALLVLASIVAFPARAASPREALVVTVEQLASRLGDPDLVLLHVGDRAEYDRGHIPGARYVSTADVAASDRSGDGLHLEMPAADVLEHRLEALGIGDRSAVVVYYGKDWISPTTRVVFTLDAAGLGGRTALLDGGQAAWVRAGHALSTDVPVVKAGQLSPLTLRPLVVDAAFVRAHLGAPGHAIVDARDSAFYEGSKTGGSPERPHRAGHIRSARSVPFSELVDDQLMIRSDADLRAAFARAGVKPGDTVITYCHIGQQATASLFAARLLGHPVLLYDGSFEEWSRAEDAPVETTTTTP